ncbi:hypothetical protein WICPIJ_002580 [Wickerhamomyces pijperi]|uniref:Uncharacterized protein n=1 Tax=Wickerhamomyces pijperi TaxID=599730 RepID=A0A9P8TPH3_WICPI|nr:hypothetical protein WICPIJ_002580 [Wickerhamomyces pijperi]
MFRSQKQSSSIKKSFLMKSKKLDCIFDGDKDIEIFRQPSPTLYHFHCQPILVDSSIYWFRIFKENVFPKIIREDLDVTFDTMMFKVILHKKKSLFGSAWNVPVRKETVFNVYLIKEAMSLDELHDRVQDLIIELRNQDDENKRPDRFPNEISQHYDFPSQEQVHSYINSPAFVCRKKIVRFFPYMMEKQTPLLTRVQWISILTCFNNLLIDHRSNDGAIALDGYFQKMSFFRVPNDRTYYDSNFSDRFILISKEHKKYFQQSFVDYMYRSHKKSCEEFVFEYPIDIKIHHPGAIMHDPDDEIIDKIFNWKAFKSRLAVKPKTERKIAEKLERSTPNKSPVNISTPVEPPKKPQPAVCHHKLHDRDSSIKQLKMN